MRTLPQTLTDARLDSNKSYKQFTMKNTKLYFNNRTERQWESYSLREMVDLLKLPDEGNINLVNVPDLVVCVAGIKKRYDLWGYGAALIVVTTPTSPSSSRCRISRCLSRTRSI